MKIFNFGSVNIDYTYDVVEMVKAGETISSLNFSKHMGGKGLNQSISLAKAGADVVHMGCVGSDGEFLVDRLKEENIDTSRMRTVDSPTGHAIIQLDAKGENCIILFAGSNHCFDKEYIDACFEGITQEDLILLQNEISNIDYIIEQSFSGGIKVAVNLSPINSNVEKVDLSKITYLLINESEGKAITGLSDHMEIGKDLVRRYPNIHVVLTIGSEGVLYFHKDEVIRQSAFKAKVVDTTGAGDTFTGYFLAMLLKGESIQKSLETACYASSLAIGIKGTSNSIPKLEEVMNFFDVGGKNE